MSLYLCPRWRNKIDLFIYSFIYLFNLSYVRSLLNIYLKITVWAECIIDKHYVFHFYHPARGIVGRVTDSRVRGLGFKSQGSILTSITETSSPSRVARDGGDPCSVPSSG